MRSKLRYVIPMALALSWPEVCAAGSQDVQTLAGDPAQARDSPPDPAGLAAPVDPELESGLMLRSLAGRKWGLRLQLPFSIGLTRFDLSSGVSLDDLATLAFVPTAEFIVPLNPRWALLPFVGLGGAIQLGERELVGGSRVLGFVTGGLRVQRWQPFAERYAFVLMSQIRYDVTLTGGGGLLDDSGRFDAALELRRAFGAPREGPRFQAGIYAQGFWFWDPVELRVAGVSPSIIDDERQIGISLGTTSPYKLWIIPLPRVFVGYGVGDGLKVLRIRFGRL